MARYGADGQGVTDAIAALKSAWDAASATTPSVCASVALREATRISEDGFTALSFGDATVYPHQQVQYDMQLLSRAITQLSNGKPHQAAGSIANVDLNGLASILSEPGFATELLHHDPAYERISWGGRAARRRRSTSTTRGTRSRRRRRARSCMRRSTTCSGSDRPPPMSTASGSPA